MEFWQAFLPRPETRAAWTDAFDAALPDGSGLRLPIRDLGDHAVAGLIANQAAFAVTRRLSGWMAEVARPLAAEVVVGLPTLGQVFAPAVAEALGHPNWAAPSWSRKRWYEEALSAPARSVTSPAERRLWLDPRLLPRLAGRRVLLVDDVVSTGASARAGLALLAAAGVRPVPCWLRWSRATAGRPAGRRRCRCAASSPRPSSPARPAAGPPAPAPRRMTSAP